MHIIVGNEYVCTFSNGSKCMLIIKGYSPKLNMASVRATKKLDSSVYVGQEGFIINVRERLFPEYAITNDNLVNLLKKGDDCAI